MRSQRALLSACTYLVVVYVLLYIFVCVTLPPVRVALQNPAASVPSPTPSRVAQWIQGTIPGVDTGSLELDLMRLRQLTFRHVVPAAMQDKEALKKLLANDPDEAPADQQYAALRVFGLVPPGFDVAKFRLDLLTSQIGGFYDPRTKKFNVIDQGMTAAWMSGAIGLLMGFHADAIITIHEMDHALTDQYFDIMHVESALKTAHNDDQELAATALIEGDATWLMMAYALENVAGGLSLDDWAEDQMRTFVDQASTQGGDSLGDIDGKPVPLVYRRSLVFPYLPGLAFIHHLRCVGEGWTAVNQAWSDVPVSTQQVLHPERYSGERMVPVQLGWKAPFKAVVGWTPAVENTMGEFLTTVFLEQNLRDPGWQLAAHWRGDRYRVYRHGSNLALQWTSEWDGPEIAATFADRVSAVFGPHGRMDHRLAGVFRIEHKGPDVNVVYGASPPLAKVLWAQRSQVTRRTAHKAVKVHFDAGWIAARVTEPPGQHDRLLSLQPQADFAQRGNEWASAAQGVGLQLPSGWTTDSDISGTTVFRARGTQPHVGLAVTLPHKSPDVAADIQSGSQEWMDSPKLLREWTELSDGAPIHEFEYEGQSSGWHSTVRVRWATATHRGRTVYVVVYWPPADAPDGEAQADTVVRSLRLF